MSNLVYIIGYSSILLFVCIFFGIVAYDITTASNVCKGAGYDGYSERINDKIICEKSTVINGSLVKTYGEYVIGDD